MSNTVNTWIETAAKTQDPVVFISAQAKNESAQITWLLLSCAMQQDIKLADLITLITELQKKTPDIAAIPVLKEETIMQIINSKYAWKSWKLAHLAPGIIWSVGRFARERGNDLHQWAKERTPTEIWKECGEIFYMGKNNALRPKALNFLHKLTLPKPTGMGIKLVPEKTKTKPPPLPVTPGARRWMYKTGIYNQEETPKEKLHTANTLYRNLYSKNPALACHALQFFTEPINENDYYCSTKITKCTLCPVSLYCTLQH